MRVKRKNFFPTLILIVMLWGLLAAMIFWVDPQLVRDVLVPGAYLPFFGLFFPASFLTLALLLADATRGLLAALGLTIFLVLRIFELGNLLNLLLIFGLVIALDRYRQH